MIVRQAVPEDATGLALVARRAITITAAQAYSETQIQQWASHFTDAQIADAIATTTVLVVDSGQTTCGFANLLFTSAGRAEIDLLYVDPDFVGQGIARRAVDAVEKEAVGRNVRRLWADASLPATPMLEHLGYVVEQRYEKHVGALVYPNAWLSKPL